MKSLLYSFLSILFILMACTNQANATPPDWDPPTNLQFNMQIVARLTAIDGTFSEVEADLVAAFVGNECRGLASPIVDAGGLVFLTVGSDIQSGETITFKAWYSVTGQVADLNEIIEFQDAGEVGTFNDPFIFTIQTLYPPAIYTIVSTASGNGNISPSGTIELVHGSNQLYLITPDPVNHVFDVKINGESIGGFIDSYEFVNLQQNSTIHVEFAVGTGLGEAAKSSLVKAWPNPATDVLNLQLDTPLQPATSYFLSTTSGETLLQGSLSDQTEEISLHGLPNGVYLLTVRQNGQWIASRRFTIIR
ncbi:MAG: T9SS type A sorting domain-containing protein [Bacteroidales bacterium]|nr:T9SS type A sorting domain-containing protein [Bacteroidales bacterium]